jgi:hypothetical protein
MVAYIDVLGWRELVKKSAEYPRVIVTPVARRHSTLGPQSIVEYIREDFDGMREGFFLRTRSQGQVNALQHR